MSISTINIVTGITILWLVVSPAPCHSHSLQPEFVKTLHDCPHINPKVHHGMGVNQEKPGNREVIGNAHNLTECVSACCNNDKCGVGLMQYGVCFSLQCHTIEQCNLIPVNDSLYVIVNTMQDDEAELKQSTSLSHVETEDDGGGGGGEGGERRCEVGLMECGQYAVCEPFGHHRRNGYCQCIDGYHWESLMGGCVEKVTTGEEAHTTTLTSLLTSTPETVITSTPGKEEKLLVNINNKTVILPESTSVYEEKVTLSAYAIGGDTDCKYEWKLLESPKSEDTTGSMSDLHSQTITLTHLTQGVYIFKVQVITAGARGEAVGNVTVKPARHSNLPPKAVIVSPSQAIKLPTSGVVIDGSGSTDDDGIVSYSWQVVSAPLGYQFKQSDMSEPTLQLTDLIPGNYTIMLFVKDKEGLQGNATTFLTIIKETDYPPTANAGGDQIIYLPQTKTVLYGNLSTDDHGIEEWEWTKGPKDSGKAVDMQDTRTPYLRLSNLEEGHYQFILKVTDSLHQSSNTSVYVYVQQPNLATPKANAGADMVIVLPNTTVLLDGSASSDTSTNTHWEWKQLSGPSESHLSSPGQAQTNASDLTKGKYSFQLTVWSDDHNKNTTDVVTVTVRQDHNAVPVANAGGDFSVILPVSAVVVDGSNSSDDVGITKWLWERDATSLAAGNIINGSDHSSVLMFTGVVAGRYVWRLTVWDDQGVSSSDTVSIIVKESPHHLDEVTVVVGADLGSLSMLQLTTLLQKMELFLHAADRVVTIHLISLTGLPHSGEVSVTFIAKAGKKIVPGVEVVTTLRHQVLIDSSDLLDLPLLSLDTVVCQNNCSGHGECVEASRECHCHTWWMESFFRRHLGDGMQNCDWSVVYVFVIICVMVLFFGLLVWGMAVLVGQRLRSNTRIKRRPPRYSLLNTYEEGIKLQARPPGTLMDSASESNTEDEIHFDSRSHKHKSDKLRNGYHKLSRIRT